MKSVTTSAIASLSLLAASLTFSAAPDSPLRDASDGTDWPAFGRTYGEQHFSPLDQINTNTIGHLKLAWFVDLPLGNSVSGPLEIAGVLYTATGYSVVRAFDAITGKQLWERDPLVARSAGRKLRVGWGIRGLAWWDGKLFVGAQDGRLIALDAKTGAQIWSVMTVDKDDARFISGAPRAFDGKVIIGHGGADTGVTRGYVTAYDAETGRQLWRFFAVPGDPAQGFENPAMAMAAKTWAGRWWEQGGGGTVWNAITYDADIDQILIGTGNGAPWNRRLRSAGQGDNLFLDSIVALDAKTGAYRWHYQTNPGESWDYNASMDMELATLTIQGKPRKVVIQAPKNGFLYVIDRTNGKLLSAEPIGRVNWASKIDITSGRPVEMPGIRFENGTRIELWPGPNGVHNWLPMSFDPRTHIVYIPTLNMPGTYDDRGISPDNWHRIPGNAVDVGVNFQLESKDPTANTGSLVAWDALTQKQVWRVANPGFWNGGTMATAGNLVFQGWADGTFNAFDAATGKRLWQFNAQNGVLAPPITYRIDGRQYVTVLSGFGVSGACFGESVARFNWQYRAQLRRVLTFALDGTAELPQAHPNPPVVPIKDHNYHPDLGLLPQGASVYGHRCLSCHGVGVIAAGSAPDLRASTIPSDANAFNEVVRNGALVPAGMPQFEELSDQEIKGLREYIRSEAER